MASWTHKSRTQPNQRAKRMIASIWRWKHNSVLRPRHWWVRSFRVWRRQCRKRISRGPRWTQICLSRLCTILKLSRIMTWKCQKRVISWTTRNQTTQTSISKTWALRTGRRRMCPRPCRHLSRPSRWTRQVLWTPGGRLAINNSVISDDK